MTRPILEYYGLSSFSVEYGDVRILVDPWLDGPEWSTASVDDFDDLDYVFVTHGAYDHLADAYPVAERTGAQVVTEPAVADHLVAEGLPPGQVRRVIWGNAFTENGFSVRVLETRHLSYFESGDRRLSGMPLGFHFEFGGASLYYVGDTSLFSDLELFVRLNDPDVVLLPVGSAPGDLAPLPPRDAAEVVSWLDVETVVPVHYVPGSNEVREFEANVAATGRADDSPNVEVLNVGDRYRI
ncbi:MBL fold metallo-hydrolase [Halegenticoccus tardaugens]|uniref:MBL fold metallo-hydrolase n=1 Tax=Halegenticoccus tardaugens TaxID=2071624 RepID=UPI0013E991D7|nr:MBL fold metallo-hydrolase [Halegenticoccus tardaugens]